MKSTIKMCGNNVRGFSLECDVIEALLLNRALRQFIEDPLGDNCDADKLIAKRMLDALLGAKEAQDE